MSTRKRRSRGLDDAVSYIAKGIKPLNALFSDFNIDMCLPFTIKIFIINVTLVGAKICYTF